MFKNVFESCSLTTTCSLVPCVNCAQKYLKGETVVQHSDTVASPAELVLNYHCLNTSSVGLREDTDIGAAMFLSDTKYIYEATLAEFFQGLHMTSKK